MAPAGDRLLVLFGLPAAVGFAVLVAYVPHLDVAEDARSDALPSGLAGLAQGYGQWLMGHRDDYEYTLHVDENHHWAFMAQLQRQETVRFDEPYTGEPARGTFRLSGTVHEKGFHLAVSQFQEITALPWPFVIRFLPALWMGVSAWAIFSLLWPWRGAPLAAALAALAPTTPRFIGPGFLVPIGFGLAWIPVAALLARRTLDERRNPAPLLVVVAWGFFIHVIVGVACALVLLASVPWARDRRRAGLLLILSLLPALWLAKTFAGEISAETTKFTFLPVQRTVFLQLGFPFLAAWLLGFFLLLFRRPAANRVALMPFAALSALTFGMITLDLAFHLHNYFLYERWHQIFAVSAAVPAAHAVLQVAEAASRLGRRRPAALLVGGVTAVLLGGAVLHVGVEGHLRERYYHILDDRDWASFAWAAEHLPASYSTFLANPWKAPVLNALTGHRPVAVLYPGTPPLNGEAYTIYRAGGHGDGAFLVQNDATWVADTQATTAPEYEPLGPDVYGLRPAYLAAYNAATRG